MQARCGGRVVRERLGAGEWLVLDFLAPTTAGRVVHL